MRALSCRPRRLSLGLGHIDGGGLRTPVSTEQKSPFHAQLPRTSSRWPAKMWWWDVGARPHVPIGCPAHDGCFGVILTLENLNRLIDSEEIKVQEQMASPMNSTKHAKMI